MAALVIECFLFKREQKFASIFIVKRFNRLIVPNKPMKNKIEEHKEVNEAKITEIIWWKNNRNGSNTIWNSYFLYHMP